MEFVNLFIALSTHHIRYLICGGLAINIYGIPRSTADIDLVLDLEEENIKKFLNIISSVGYLPHLSISLHDLVNKEQRNDFIKNKNLIAYSFYNSTNNVMSMDVLIDTPVDFTTMWSNREIRNIGGKEVTIVSIADLILMKKYAGRLQDERDIILLSQMIKK